MSHGRTSMWPLGHPIVLLALVGRLYPPVSRSPIEVLVLSSEVTRWRLPLFGCDASVQRSVDAWAVPNSGFFGDHRAMTPLLRALASSLCSRRFCVFLMSSTCHRAGPVDVNLCSTGTSAGGSIFLRCSLRISLLCHGLGQGCILSSRVSRMPRVSSSPQVS